MGFSRAAWCSYWSWSFGHITATHSSLSDGPLKLSSKHLYAIVRTLKCTSGLLDKTGAGGAFICRRFSALFSFSVLAFHIFLFLTSLPKSFMVRCSAPSLYCVWIKLGVGLSRRDWWRSEGLLRITAYRVTLSATHCIIVWVVMLETICHINILYPNKILSDCFPCINI